MRSLQKVRAIQRKQDEIRQASIEYEKSGEVSRPLKRDNPAKKKQPPLSTISDKGGRPKFVLKENSGMMS